MFLFSHLKASFFRKWGANMVLDPTLQGAYCPESTSTMSKHALKMFDRAIKSSPRDWKSYIHKSDLLLRIGVRIPTPEPINNIFYMFKIAKYIPQNPYNFL